MCVTIACVQLGVILRYFLLLSFLVLQGCGWESAARLIPISERAIPNISGRYVVEGRVINFGRQFRNRLQRLTITFENGDVVTSDVAFDLVKTSGAIEDGIDGRTLTYLIESEEKKGDGTTYSYNLIDVQKVYGEDNSFRGKYDFKRYTLRCAAASASYNNGPETGCKFSRYSDLMGATADVLGWMSDPRISLERENGYPERSR